MDTGNDERLAILGTKIFLHDAPVAPAIVTFDVDIVHAPSTPDDLAVRLIAIGLKLGCRFGGHVR